jgi:uncharacterized membrane protein (DUF4010 family)
MPETPEGLQRLLVALLVGLLVGLDRERAEVRKQRPLFAGVRTFPLIALLGAGLALLQPQLGVAPFVTGFVAVAAIALVSYQTASRAGDVGATTEVAALVTYAVGALAGTGQMMIAGAVGVAVAVLLAIKPNIERLSRAMTDEELFAVLRLVVISAIVLPLLPNKAYGPWQVWNPFKIWLVVVLVSAISFAGFVAIRWKGERAGLYLAAALGAMVSSTATTVAMAQRSHEDHTKHVAAAAVLASVVMSARLLVLAAAVRPPIVLRLLPPAAAMALVGLAAVWLLRRAAGSERVTSQPPRKAAENPFSLKSAATFALLFAAILLLVRASQAWLGPRGELLAAVLAGLVDVDAITVALSRSASLDASGTVVAIIAAAASNDLFKAAVAVFAGAGSFRRDVAVALVAMAAAGLGVAIPLRHLG